WLIRNLPVALDGLRRRRPWLCVFWLLFGLAALGRTAQLSSFMLDPARSDRSLFPADSWYVEHCCLTAYTESARLNAEGAQNIYDPKLYYDRKVGIFNVDPFHYPPPFLLVPMAARAVAGGGAGEAGFLDVRKLWFGVSALALLAAIGLLAARL